MKANGGPLLQNDESFKCATTGCRNICTLWHVSLHSRVVGVEYYDKGLEPNASNAAMLVIHRPVNL